MSAKHTPGPWERISSADWDGAHVIDGNFRIVAVCDGCDIPGASSEVGVDEAKSNAYIIAAAPELLAALEGMVAEYEEPDAIFRDSAEVQAARAAIAKAKGEA